MKKNNYLNTMIITSFLILLGMVGGLLLWKQLPDKIATHFSTQDVADGWSSKNMTVFGLPLFMLFIHWVVFFGISADPKKKNIQDSLFKSVMWIVPVLSLVMMFSIYGMALGYSLQVGGIVQGLLGVVFIFLGNYLHQVKQNYTVGIRLPWTLNSTENWNRTHRLGAWLFFVGGLILIGNIFFNQNWVMVAVIFIVVFIPTVYSYFLYRKGV